jgi:hypothetical protein
VVHHFRIWLLACVCLFVCSSFAYADAPATQPSEDASYEAAIDKRANDTVKAIKLDDKAKEVRVHNLVANQYRNLKKLDDERDAKLKDAGKDKDKTAAINDDLLKGRKTLHDQFLMDLSKDLTEDQIVIVKDKMTYNVLHVTYDAYCDMIPTLTDTQKQHIMQLLVDARELAMDGGSSKEKHDIFGKYKGKINIYLSKEGYDQKKEEAAWRERLKARRAAATQPATQPGN